ncbi:hypothetical protein [Marinivivus vitaminiproducens]|uniref:hypothetical protein n=1 Tax=Marinivivus vitaminiproducens TaxID=3035935 RepID=UPI0027A5830F|nr:hypothetical protein P4R82_14050 [Geminicoccaceae bacterium SCSIO 64248]
MDWAVIFTNSNTYLACFTLALVFYTALLAREARKTRELQISPIVVVSIEPARYQTFATLVIENTGFGVAREIEISFDPDITIKRENIGDIVKLSSLTITKIPLLKPKQSLSISIGRFNNISPSCSVVSISCRDSLGKKHTYSNRIDISVYDDMSKLGVDALEGIEKELKKFSQDLKNVMSGFKRLRVDVFNNVDRKRENEELERNWRNSEGP